MEDTRAPAARDEAIAALPAAVADEVALLLEHLNDGHADTIRLVASVVADDLAAAEITAVDRNGFRLDARRCDGTRTALALPFDGRPESVLAIRAELFGMLRRARERAGDAVPLTSLERDLAASARLSTFVTSVAHAEDITPSLRRITLRGGLAGYVPLAADQFVYLMASRPSQRVDTIAPGFRMEDMEGLPAAERPAAAYYTVRRFDAAREEIELWCVLHAHGDGVATWARRAQPGDRVALWGPRSSFAPPPCRSLLLVGDETALPAFAAILERHGHEKRIQVVLETSDAEHVVDLPGGPEVSLCWLFRGAQAPGTSGRLLDAVRELKLDAGLGYAFGAAEAHEIAAVRRHLRAERGLPADRVRMIGYWRRTPDDARAGERLTTTPRRVRRRPGGVAAPPGPRAGAR